MNDNQASTMTVALTGAWSYSGRPIADTLLSNGHRKSSNPYLIEPIHRHLIRTWEGG